LNREDVIHCYLTLLTAVEVVTERNPEHGLASLSKPICLSGDMTRGRELTSALPILNAPKRRLRLDNDVLNAIIGLKAIVMTLSSKKD
jgi:hypothetical protein